MSITPSKRSEFERLFSEFANGYLKGSDGKAIINGLRQAHDDAQRNFASLNSKSSAEVSQSLAADRTSEILLKLLPYTNNANNRWRGAWLHPLPAISGDIRKWYEAAGWTKASDWEAVAQALLEFVRRCTENPDQLEAACAELNSSALGKGFQSATLTPILHALRPNDFLLLNNRVRHVLNYFTNRSYSQSLADYPSANAALHEFIETHADFLQKFAVRRLFLADLFAIFCHWLTSVKKYPLRKERYWRIALGDPHNSDPHNGDIWLWEEWQEGNFIALGWDDLGDLSQLKRGEFEQLRNSLVTQHLDYSKASLDQVWRFSRQLSEGDHIIVEFANKAILGTGTVVGGYYFVPEIGYGHRIPVLWENVTSRERQSPPLKAPLVESSEAEFSSLSVAPPIDLRSVVAISPQPETPPTLKESRSAYSAESPITNPESDISDTQSALRIPHSALRTPISLSQISQSTFLDESLLATWIAAIERKGQAIFFGPPGVGKTYIATQLAHHLASVHPSQIDESEGTRNSQLAIRNSPGLTDIVQFHPAYEYEDFVQGIRPVSKGSGVEFAIVPGRFLEFCRKAENHSGRCVLVIDEINRANLSRVFGELMYLLEYRDQSLRLAADGSLFRIPANLRILGTMNTADRSIALVDHALRRRFAFIHLTPNYEVLRRFAAQHAIDFPIETLINTLQRLNQRIEDRNYELGHSFFLRTNLPVEIESIWRLEIEPYLEEYFFDQPDEVDNWRWERVKKDFGL